ncbi:transcriptional regulator [Bradyrhizobium iriomotense]|uniref:transcriptional regulator n=1 Tax=Bradyrhizobium iriomotense TaxID=441950 RepID=UPI001B89FF49|nr:transcriptional regulator [Bradyrhizobium iriomotense]MBR0780036.1 transcriptional regulator [Bradyrhizobium iriomotense]
MDEPTLYLNPVEIPKDRLSEFQEFFEDLNKETDRGAALSTTAFIDSLLERLLTAFLIPNKSARELISEANSPLGTFSARIRACHAIGLISDTEFKECTILRKIRNEFAHKVKMSFDDDRVKGLCSGISQLGEWPDGQPVVARLKFHLSAIAIIMNLTNRPRQAEELALKYKPWKR